MSNRYQKNKEKLKANTIKFLHEHPEKRLYWACKGIAKRKGLEFNIIPSDIIIPEICPYLGVPITNIWGHGSIQSNLSIDRIDSYKGYIKGNIQVISHLANRMKQEATPEQLIAFAHGILAIYKK